MSANAFHASSRHADPTDRHTQLVTQTQKWVAQTFYGTLLKQMRNSPFKNEMFEGGRGGEAFQSMFDQQLADRMSRSAGGKLVNAIVKKIEARETHAKSSHAASSAALLRGAK